MPATAAGRSRENGNVVMPALMGNRGGTGYSLRMEEEVPDLLSPALFRLTMIDQVGQDACAAPDTGFAGGFLASSE
jgi:hypothetical protein